MLVDKPRSAKRSAGPVQRGFKGTPQGTSKPFWGFQGSVSFDSQVGSNPVVDFSPQKKTRGLVRLPRGPKTTGTLEFHIGTARLHKANIGFYLHVPSPDFRTASARSRGCSAMRVETGGLRVGGQVGSCSSFFLQFLAVGVNFGFSVPGPKGNPPYFSGICRVGSKRGFSKEV